jgi:hypothetical protein
MLLGLPYRYERTVIRLINKIHTTVVSIELIVVILMVNAAVLKSLVGCHDIGDAGLAVGLDKRFISIEIVRNKQNSEAIVMQRSLL